jgi:hypothetical protein
VARLTEVWRHGDIVLSDIPQLDVYPSLQKLAGSPPESAGLFLDSL